uniref:Sema domain-containing protein n=1 Tax=Romanomermis culicivorax TaxID=13658 RepID=A0A915L4G6_ROMCU
PNFVSSFADDTSVYFWFRETAAEYTDHGRQIYGRVARVCKGDQGSITAKKSQQREFGTWTTFLKARLNCSMPGDIPFYFNELQATTQIISGLYGPTAEPSSIVYAVFSTPYTGMQASAICAYRLQDVQRIFNKGAFKHQPDSKSLWQPISKSYRTGNCDLNSEAISDDMANFVQKNSLMHEAVPNFFGEPIFVDTNLKSQMTQVVVHKAKTVDGAVYDVLFVGTSDGRVLKLVNCQQNSRSNIVSTVFIDSVRLFPNRAAVQNLLVYDRGEFRDLKFMQKDDKSNY